MPDTTTLDIRVHRPFDRDQLLADLRVVHADGLQVARSLAIATTLVGGSGAILVPMFVGMGSGYVFAFLGLAAFGWYVLHGTVQSLRRAVDQLPPACRETCVITVTEDRISQEYPALRSELAWTAVTRVSETGTGWLLRYGPHQAVSLPRDGLTEEQASRLRSHVATLGLVA